MLQTMRDRAKSWVTFVIVGIIAFMMAVTGLETLTPNPNNPKVASVNGEKITRAELNQEIEQQRRALAQRGNAEIDEQQLAETSLQALIDRQLLLQFAGRGDMGVGQKALDAMILEMPEFQIEGRFDRNRFLSVLRSVGLTPVRFQQLLADESVMSQFQIGVAASEFVTDAERERIYALQHQQRKISWLSLKKDQFVDDVTPPADEMVVARYEEDAEQFMSEESVEISYLELDKSTVEADVEVTSADIEDEYSRRQQALENDAQTRVSVLLLETGEKRSEEEAEVLAEELKSRVDAGERFFDLARDHSEDLVSAPEGGDIGIVQAGIFGEQFDAAVASLERGEVSEPIRTAQGVQLLQVTERTVPELPPLSELTDQIRADLRKERSESLYLDTLRQLSDISFESSDLAQPSERFGLEIQHAGPFTRKGGESGLAADGKVVKAAFSDDVLELGANSELLELTAERAVVLRIRKHHPSELRPLDQVKGEIVQILQNEAVRALQEARVEELLAEWNSAGSESQPQWEKTRTVDRNDRQVPAAILSQVFKMPRIAESSESYTTVWLDDGSLSVVRLEQVVDGKKDESSEVNRFTDLLLARENGRHILDEYVEGIRNETKIRIYQK